jgi:hypothetical protein
MDNCSVCGDLTGLDEAELCASLGGEDHHRRPARESSSAKLTHHAGVVKAYLNSIHREVNSISVRKSTRPHFNPGICLPKSSRAMVDALLIASQNM